MTGPLWALALPRHDPAALTSSRRAAEMAVSGYPNSTIRDEASTIRPTSRGAAQPSSLVGRASPEG